MSHEREIILNNWRDGRSIAGIMLELKNEGIKRSARSIDKALRNARENGCKLPPAEKNAGLSGHNQCLLDKRADLHWMDSRRQQPFFEETLSPDLINELLYGKESGEA